MTALLDVNVIVALAWPNHLHHRAATKWFRGNHERGWATCPVTETGFVRVSSNRRVFRDARSPAEAIRILRQWRELPGHEFWADDVSIADCDDIDLDRILGYRQVTDAHLLALAVRNGGPLVSFDGALPTLTDNDDALVLLRV